jgi:hypothetical protein
LFEPAISVRQLLTSHQDLEQMTENIIEGIIDGAIDTATAPVTTQEHIFAGMM